MCVLSNQERVDTVHYISMTIHYLLSLPSIPSLKCFSLKLLPLYTSRFSAEFYTTGLRIVQYWEHFGITEETPFKSELFRDSKLATNIHRLNTEIVSSSCTPDYLSFSKTRAV